MEVADICCEGRVVSVLEGGYGRTARSAASNNTSPSIDNEDDDEGNMLDKSLFSECGIRHLRAMIDPYNEENLYVED
jgi:hypothetical protein